MPGLIDNHVHMMFNSLSPAQMSDPEMGLEKVMQLSAQQARAMLMRGFAPFEAIPVVRKRAQKLSSQGQW